jgi:hypothetical protein
MTMLSPTIITAILYEVTSITILQFDVVHSGDGHTNPHTTSDPSASVSSAALAHHYFH